MKYTQNELLEVLKNPRYTPIRPLPSQFYPYSSRYIKEPWDTLYIRPFEVAELSLISKAAVLKDKSLLVRALDLVITQDANTLTIGDFYYLLMWLRLTSFPKRPLVVSWKCSESYLIHKETKQIIFNDETFVQPEDISEYDLLPCGNDNSLQVHMTDVNIISLPDPEDPTESKWEDLPPGFDFPRAKHLQQIDAFLEDPATNMLVGSIQWIEGETLAEKYAKLLKSPDGGMEIFDTAMVLNEKINHGIGESCTIACLGCRKKNLYEVTLTPFSFFL